MTDDRLEAEAAEEAPEVDVDEAVDVESIARERDEYLDALQRLKAEFDNYRKRVARDQAALTDRATERVIESILPSLDAFEMAVVSLGDADEKVRKGVELAVGELNGVLERHGLTRVAEIDVPFDPNHHEAVMQDDGDGEPHVGAVLRTGYALNGRVLRPAMVKVTRADAAQDGRPGEATA